MRVLLFVFVLLSSFTFAQAEQEERNKTLVRDFFEVVLNEGELSRAGEFVAEDYVQHNPLVPQGLDGFKEGLGAWRTAFPDYRSTIKDIIAEDDRVWVWHTATGTHINDYAGLPATGNRFELDVLDVFRVRGGKLEEHWDLFNFSALADQLVGEP